MTHRLPAFEPDFTPPAATPTITGLTTLSHREREMVDLVAEGLSNQEISDRSGLKVHTVKNYIATAMDKLGAESRVQVALIVLAARPCAHCGKVAQ